MGRAFANLAALAVVLLSGVVHGLWTGRWNGSSRALEAAVARIGRIPAAFGDWEGQPFALDRKMLARAEVDGYLARRYRNRRDDTEVSVLLVCGRPGRISLHTPDVCYQGAGYGAVAEPVREVVPGSSAAFKTAEFRKHGAAVPETLKIAWSWNTAGTWEAPDHPRLKFAPAPFLYKLYIIRRAVSADARAEQEIVREFSRQFLPELDRALSPEATR